MSKYRPPFPQIKSPDRPDGEAAATRSAIARSKKLLEETAHMIDPRTRLIVARVVRDDGAVREASEADGSAHLPDDE